MTKVRSLFLSLAVAGSALVTAAPALADALVVRSTGPSAASYPVGRRLPDDGRVVLRAGDRVVLVSNSGTRTLSGPGTYSVRAGAIRSQGSRATLNRYINSSGGTISRAGAVRGGSSGENAPNLWILDIRHGGTFCVADPAQLALWRSSTGDSPALSVERLDTPGASPVALNLASRTPIAWQAANLPVAEGARYRLSGAGLAQPVEVQFALTPNPPRDAAGVANLLADRGCTGQLTQLGENMG
jgi:hypothetical protein